MSGGKESESEMTMQLQAIRLVEAFAVAVEVGQWFTTSDHVGPVEAYSSFPRPDGTQVIDGKTASGVWAVAILPGDKLVTIIVGMKGKSS
jgi:hypothetical protein